MQKFNLQFFGAAEHEAVGILAELNKDYPNMDADTQVEVAKLVQLTRIADNLEGINENLSTMKEALTTLTECVGYIPPRPHQKEGYCFLRIGGDVYSN